jgi:hypothetical protein
MLGEYGRVMYGEDLTPLLTAADYSDEVAADADEGEVFDEEEEEVVGKWGSDEWVEVVTTKGIEDGLLLF